MDVRRAALTAVRDQRHERRQQLRQPRLHDGDRGPRQGRIHPPGPVLHRGVRGLDAPLGHLPLHRGAARPVVAGVRDGTGHSALPDRRDLLPAGHVQATDQPGPADHGGRALVYRHHPVLCAHAAQQQFHRGGVFRGALVDQPATLPGRRAVCRIRLTVDGGPRSPAGPIQLRSAGQRGESSLRSHPCPRARGTGDDGPLRGSADSEPAGSTGIAGGQLSPNHRYQPEPGLFHHGLQLDDPDHSGADHRPGLHRRPGRVRCDHPVGDGLCDPRGGLFPDRDPVPVHLQLRRRGRTARVAGGGHGDAAKHSRTRRVDPGGGRAPGLRGTQSAFARGRPAAAQGPVAFPSPREPGCWFAARTRPRAWPCSAPPRVCAWKERDASSDRARTSSCASPSGLTCRRAPCAKPWCAGDGRRGVRRADSRTAPPIRSSVGPAAGRRARHAAGVVDTAVAERAATARRRPRHPRRTSLRGPGSSGNRLGRGAAARGSRGVCPIPPLRISALGDPTSRRRSTTRSSTSARTAAGPGRCTDKAGHLRQTASTS